MPGRLKKTGQRKKHDKMKAMQKEIGKLGTKDHLNIVERPCNYTMECDVCERRQKNRAFCYFCLAVQVDTTVPTTLLLEQMT